LTNKRQSIDVRRIVINLQTKLSYSLKKFLIATSILLLCAAGYFAYDTWVKDSNITNWSFVPENALFVYETNTPFATLEEVKKTAVWKNLYSVPLFSSIESKLQILDTLSGEGGFSNIYKNSSTLISLHPVSSDDFDFLFTVEIDKLSKHSFVSRTLDNLKNKGYSQKTHEYLDFTITEIASPSNQKVLTYIFFKNYFIASFSSYLVEDAVRTVSQAEHLSFLEAYPELINVTKLEMDQGNVYFNFNKYTSLISGVSNVQFNSNLAKSAFLDLQVSDQAINLSGFTFVNDAKDYLSIFQQNPGSTFDIAEIIPMETSWAYHFNLSDPKEFAIKLNNYLASNDDVVIKKRAEVLKEFDFNINHTFDLIDGEIAIVNLEPIRQGNNDQFLFLEIKDMDEALRYFNSLGERVAQSTNDTAYVETFGNYEIRKLPVDDYPYALLGKIADVFENTFYLQYRNYLVFSNNLLQLKNLTIAIENEDTWTKSLKVKKMLDQSNQSANLSLFINTPRAWNAATSHLKASWQPFVQQNNFALRNLEFIALQFSAVDTKFYTSFTAYQSYTPSGKTPNEIEVAKSVTFTDAVITKPYMITNHETKSKEIVLQDSGLQVHQIDADFNTIWSKNIGDRIVSDIQQIDYYKNGRLQIIFASKRQIHIIDRTGEYVAGFPKNIPGDRDLAFISVIDYDNSKNYRYAIANTQGNVYLTDKDVKPLDGWAPKKFDSPLTQAPKHHRIGKRDVIAVVQTNGKVHLLERRGFEMKNFPIDLKSNLEGGFFIRETNDLKSSSIHIITPTGELVEFSLEGKTINRKQIYKSDAETKFKILDDVSEESFLIVRSTGRKYEILNESTEVLFEKDYFTDAALILQYYKLGGGNNYVAFIDPSSKYLYLYNLTGKMMTSGPISAQTAITMRRMDNKFQLYRSSGANLEMLLLSL
jgi:hypothetical protein